MPAALSLIQLVQEVIESGVMVMSHQAPALAGLSALISCIDEKRCVETAKLTRPTFYLYAASSSPCFLISALSSQTMALVRASIS